MVPTDKIKDREELSAVGNRRKRVYMRERIAVIGSGDVELAVVATWSPPTVSLRNHMEWGCPRGA